MRVHAGTAFSLTVHVALAATVVWKTVDARPFQPSSPQVIVIPPSPEYGTSARSTGVPGIDFAPPELPLPSPVTFHVPSPGAPASPAFGVRRMRGDSPLGTAGPGGGPIDVWLVEERPAILAGTVPAYPEFLRQAGVEGRVVLDAVVDTNGRVEPGSLTVVSATHAGFVAPAQRAIAAALFRPARIAGRAVRVRVRVPIDFTLQRSRLRG